ncbi:MAG: hypothetical protein ACPGU7_12245 [Gammaproteobacteria bacterium]
MNTAHTKPRQQRRQQRRHRRHGDERQGHTHPCRSARHSPNRRDRHAHDRDVFQSLLDEHRAMTRRVELLHDGIATWTRSEDPRVVHLLHDHVPAMHRRLREGFALRRWDPLYAALFEHADAIHMEVELLEDGVHVTETSDDPRVVALIQAHSAAVDGFLEHGRSAASKPTAV